MLRYRRFNKSKLTRAHVKHGVKHWAFQLCSLGKTFKEHTERKAEGDAAELTARAALGHVNQHYCSQDKIALCCSGKQRLAFVVVEVETQTRHDRTRNKDTGRREKIEWWRHTSWLMLQLLQTTKTNLRHRLTRQKKKKKKRNKF